MPLFRLYCCLCRGLAVGLVLAGAIHGTEPLEGFMRQHCLRCYGFNKEEGGVRIDWLSYDFSSSRDAHHWAETLDQVNSGERPKKAEPQPTQAEFVAFHTQLDAFLKKGRAAWTAARSAVAHYRLIRKEYQNRVYDLLGVRYDPAHPGALNEDTLWHGLERIGSELTLSPSHVDRCYRAAGIVLDRAFPIAAAERCRVHKMTDGLRHGGGKDQQAALDRFGSKRPLRYLLIPGSLTVDDQDDLRTFAKLFLSAHNMCDVSSPNEKDSVCRELGKQRGVVVQASNEAILLHAWMVVACQMTFGHTA